MVVTEIIRKIWYFFAKYVLNMFPDALFINTIFLINSIRLKRPFYFLALEEPKTFTEKINWLKLRVKYPLGIILSDKFEVRKFVTERIGAEFLVQINAVYNNADEIDLNALPEQFVMKTTHGSGWNYICKDKSRIVENDLRNKFKNWLSRNPYYLSREWQYDEVNPKIICEKYLGENINDYKLFCFDSEVKYIQVDVDRFTDHKRNIYDVEWQLQDFELIYPKSISEIPCPAELDKMIILAQKLSQGMNFMRVDLYNIDGRIYFGEMTLHPEGGAGPFDSYETDLAFGKSLDLSSLLNVSERSI